MGLEQEVVVWVGHRDFGGKILVIKTFAYWRTYSKTRRPRMELCEDRMLEDERRRLKLRRERLVAEVKFWKMQKETESGWKDCQEKKWHKAFADRKLKSCHFLLTRGQSCI